MAFDPTKIVVPQSVLQRGFRPETQYGVDSINGLLTNLPTKYSNLQKESLANANRGLQGLGNYATGDDPSTAVVEGADHMYRKDKQIGDREVGAVHSEDNKANSRGLLNSSFRDRNVGDALGRLSREAQQVMTQFGGQMRSLFQQERDENVDLGGKLQQLYIGESDYLRDNPPKPPDPPPDPRTPEQQKIAQQTDAGASAGASPQKKLAVDQGWIGPWATKPASPGPGWSLFSKVVNGKTYWYGAPK